MSYLMTFLALSLGAGVTEAFRASDESSVACRKSTEQYVASHKDWLQLNILNTKDTNSKHIDTKHKRATTADTTKTRVKCCEQPIFYSSSSSFPVSCMHLIMVSNIDLNITYQNLDLRRGYVSNNPYYVVFSISNHCHFHFLKNLFATIDSITFTF